MKMLLNLTVLPGDGIGPEVTGEAVRVLESVADTFGHELKLVQKDIGGAALLASNDPLPQDTIQSCLSAGAVLLGAVGGPAFDKFPVPLRPEKGLLRLRKTLGVFANLRPATCFPSLEGCSPLRPDVVRGTDVLIVRELLGGIYFGEPRSTQGSAGHRTAIDTMRYGEQEIERIAHVAFELARSRRGKVASVDKANVLDCSRLWREVVTRVAKAYTGVQLSTCMWTRLPWRGLTSLQLRCHSYGEYVRRHPLGPGRQRGGIDRHVAFSEHWRQRGTLFRARCTVRRPTSPEAAAPIRWALFFPWP